MFNLDDITENNNNKDWPYRKLIIGASGSGKTNYLLNSIQKDNNIIDKIYLYAKDLEEPKYQLLISKREKAGIKNLNDPTAFIEYSNSMDDILNNIEVYNKKRKRKILYIIFKSNNKRELENIAINHSADIDYEDFVKIYRDCTKEPFNFLTIDTTKSVDKKFIKNFDVSL